MHPWRGRSRPPQSNLPLGTPEAVLVERHPQLIACETFLERPVRSFDPVEPSDDELGNPWARAFAGALERHAPTASKHAEGLALLRAGAVWHLSVEAGEIAAIVRDERLFPIKISLPPLGTHAESSLIDAVQGQIPGVAELLAGAVPGPVVSVLAAPGALIPPLERARIRCQCPERGFCAHAAAVMLALPRRFDERPQALFLLRRTEPEVLKGLLPAALSAKLPAEAKAIGEDEVAQLFDLRLYRREALPQLEVEPPPMGLEPSPLDDDVTPLHGTSTEWLDDDIDGPEPMRRALSRSPSTPGAEELPDIGRADLLELGVPSHRIQKMLTEGMLVRTEKRGRYQLTAEAWELIEPLLPEG